MPEEARREIATTSDGNEPPKDSNMFLYLLQRMDSMEANLRNEIRSLREENKLKFNKLDEKIDGVHRELHSTTRWIIGTILTAIGVAVAIAAWLIG